MYEYQEILFRQCEKLLRQRDYYLRLARHWERDLNTPDLQLTAEDSAALKAKIATINHSARDLTFALNQTRRSLTPEDWELIQDRANTAQAAIDRRHKTDEITITQS